MTLRHLFVDRVFDETLFRIFAKHETHENAPVFREIFASFASFARSNFRDFRISRKLSFSRKSRNYTNETQQNMPRILINQEK
jgi:hypothetical protein